MCTTPLGGLRDTRRGRRLQRFLARVPQPSNRRVLGLGGLPELVPLDLLYAIGCRVHDQVQTRTTEMWPYVNALLVAGVASLSEFDPEQLGGCRERHRFARLAYARVVWPMPTRRRNATTTFGICEFRTVRATGLLGHPPGVVA